MNESKPLFAGDKEPQRATPLEAGTTQLAEPEVPSRRGLKFYFEGGLLFFRKMWPTLYELTTNQTYMYASAITFNALMSFFSFVVLLGSFVKRVLGWDLVYEGIYRLMRLLAPVDSAQIFWSLDQVTRGKGGEVGLISFALLIIGAAGVFQILELALNDAWGFKNERSMLLQYTIYPGIVLVYGVIAIVCASIAGSWDWLMQAFFGDGIIRTWTFRLIGSLLMVPVSSIILFLTYYWVPNGKVKANQIAFASIGISILWVIGTFAYRLALPLFKFQESYGQLFAVMAVVTWIFFSSFLIILGAKISAREILPRAWERE